MNSDKALNIAVACVMTSGLENTEKRDVINKLRGFNEIIELVEYREYDDDEMIDMIDKIIKRY